MTERDDLLKALLLLDDEGFNSIAWMIYQQAKTAGGFMNHEGWKKVLDSCLKLKFIKETQAKFDEEYKKLGDR